MRHSSKLRYRGLMVLKGGLLSVFIRIVRRTLYFATCMIQSSLGHFQNAFRSLLSAGNLIKDSPQWSAT
jgi:hypothetical protein